MIKRNQLSYAEQRIVEKAVAMVCIKTEDGFAEYASGWTDSAVASHVSKAEGIVCTRWNVVHVREAAIGKLRPAAPLIDIPPAAPVDLTPVLEAIAAIAASVSELNERMARMEVGRLNAIANDAQGAREAGEFAASILSFAFPAKPPAATDDFVDPSVAPAPGGSNGH